MSLVDRIDAALYYAEQRPWLTILPAGVVLGLLIGVLL